MDYVQKIGSIIGHQPLILVGATTLVFDEQNRLLMQRRTENGMWGVPGGYMDLGEKIEDTARRETLEETGIKIGNISLIDVYSGPELFYEYTNGDQVFIVTAVYKSRDYSVYKNTHDDEVQEIGFFSIDELPESISPPVKLILDDIKQRFLNGSLVI